MATAYLDKDGLLYYHQTAVKAPLAKKVDKVDGKGLSTNDYTTAEQSKLAGIEDGANKYTHPTYTAHESGLYKVTVDSTGHVSAVTSVAKSDITALGIPGEAGGSYSTATASADGLMSKTDKANLDDLVTKSANYVTTSDMTTAIENAGHMTKTIVDAVPSATSASDTVIYLVPKTTGTDGNVYDEYLKVNNAMEKIGDTSTTITSITNSEIDTIIASA